MMNINKFFKQLTALACIIFLMGANASVFAETEAVSDALYQKQKALVALGVMDFDSYGEMDNEKEVTRAEFIGDISRFLNINPTVIADKTYFNDVPVKSWYTYTLNTLVDMGIISKADNFYPDRVISTNEAIKIMTCLLGYGTFAQLNGGYPAGYIDAARRSGLLKDLKTDGNLTNKAMSVLLYNTLDASVLEIVGFDGIPTGMETGETLLSVYRNIYSGKGVVESVYGISLSGINVGADDEIIIDGEIYKTGNIKKTEDYLGYKSKFYYEKNSNNEKTLVYIEKIRPEDLFVLSEDYIDFNGADSILYYYDGNRKCEAKMDKGAVIVKNGSVVKDGVESAFDIENGEIKLISTGESDAYDIAMIYDFQTVVVSQVNATDYIITDELNKKNIIKVSPSECEYLNIYSPTDEKLDFSNITSGTVLDVAISDNHAYIYVNSYNFSGTVTSISNDKEEIVIDGEKYDCVKGVVDTFSISRGSKGTFKTNRYGKIAAFTHDAMAFNPAYIIAVSREEGLDETVFMKMLTSDGVVEIKKLASKVKIDGNSVSSSILYNTVANYAENAMVYKLNAKGEINYIDTEEKGDNEDEFTLTRMAPYGITRYNSYSQMIGKTVPLSQSATIFNVPLKAEGKGVEKNYVKGKIADLGFNHNRYLDCFKVGDTAECNIVIYYKDIYLVAPENRAMFVEEVAESVDANGEQIKQIIGWLGSDKVTVDFVDDYPVLPKKGDVVRIGINPDDIGGALEIFVDAENEKGGYLDPTSYYYNGEGYDIINEEWNIPSFVEILATFRIGFGYPVEYEDGIIKWSYNRNSDAIDEVNRITSSTPIIVYDVQNDRMYKGDISDIKMMNAYNQQCSMIAMNLISGQVKEIYVINK